jgi:hypothetical protein
MQAYIIDIIIILVLAFYVWRGAKKGLILTLFSLLAIFVAFFGAKAVAVNFAKPVANIIRPSIQLTIEGVITGKTPADLPAASPAPSESQSDSSAAASESPETSSAAGNSDFTLQQILDLMGESEVFSGLRGFLEDAIKEKTLEVTTTAAAAVSAYLARLIATALLFGLSFLLILLLWFLISRALDLAFKVPILSAVNGLGGGLIGLIKGTLVVMVVVWLARLAGFITDANAGPLTRLMTVQALGDLLQSLMA